MIPIEDVERRKVITDRECELCKEGTVGWVAALEKRVEKLETKLWAVILLLVANLAGIVAVLLKGVK